MRPRNKIILIVFGALVLILLLVFLIHEAQIRTQPTQTVYVQVVGKRTRTRYVGKAWRKKKAKFPYCYVTFRLSDGKDKEMEIPHDLFDALQENDAGMLTFREKRNANTHNHRRFINFKKDTSSI